MTNETIIKWAEKKVEEEEGNWETKDYHQGYKDAMNDLIRHLSNRS